MAKRSRVSGTAQKAIVSMAREMTGKYNLWQIWQDWITMVAISIANAIGGPHAEAREKEYMTRAKRYTAKELDVFSQMFALVVDAMTVNPDQDFLGDLYMSMELGDTWKGQFFTPYSVCKAMASMSLSDQFIGNVEDKGWASVNDPACGAGALLIAFANECRRENVGINYQTSVLFVAQDLDYLAGMMCYIQLSLLGCPGYVVVADTIAHPAQSVDSRGLIPVDGSNVWYTPMYYRDIWNGRRTCAALDAIIRGHGQAAEKPVEAVATSTKRVATKPKEEPNHFTQTESGQLSFF